MVDGETSREDLPGYEQGVLQVERLENQRSQHLLVGLPRHLLDESSCDAERGVVVRDGVAGGRQLRERAHRPDVAGQRVVAVARVLEEVAVPTGGVVQKLQDRDRARRSLVLHAEVRQVRADGRVEVDEPLLDKPHDRRGGERLRGRSAEEERALVHGQRIVDARHAVIRVVLLAVLEDADGGARQLQLVGEARDDVAERLHDV
jgi:hypothetical protein